MTAPNASAGRALFERGDRYPVFEQNGICYGIRELLASAIARRYAGSPPFGPVRVAALTTVSKESANDTVLSPRHR